jgi:predicted SnoaL-like aldol condensation-catalyzing enzyme
MDAGGNRAVDSRQEKGTAMSNKKIVLEALTGLFVRRDVSVLDTHFAPDYRQHNPTIGNGVAALRAIAPKLSPSLKYEPGMIVEDGDIVMVHGRYVGWAEKPLVAVDIFRVRDGKLVEHWDVMQEEVPASATASGNPMFTLPS